MAASELCDRSQDITIVVDLISFSYFLLHRMCKEIKPTS
ncbi:hypothetical protein EBL_c11220 [Shimwellia blattae DSM 4481 = NBRC 105725]|uniref:Uncharacterized protein n=1 Tax=Shimwellia blattae (strain ATCC 29907 / DSM 4481 / JCM 1650 / NBRC 105725 / CDC 9005-74) TaxID=630626 RepID=I2B6S2_SHIBC|nr:hypothetical protein EBL_c11220 [Shimwellia blattae DSM 4481 = NBRC 105725]